MTGTQAAGDADPLYDWLVLRLETLAAEETGDPDARRDDLLKAVERAERCAAALTGLWPGGNSTVAASAAPDRREHRNDKVAAAGPESLGRFRIQRLLGRGGMGNVFLAFDPMLQRSVALKVPRFDVVGDPELRERFLLEARAAAKLSHPNLVEVYDAGLDGSLCYIASAYCDGPDLAQWLANRDRPVEPELAARLLAKLAAAIHCCHQIGIVHRDLKPANILLATDSQAAGQDGMAFTPKITDFGLARALEESLVQTRTSLIVGTPLYMAPEQAEGRAENVGPGTDIFALGRSSMNC